MFFTCPECGHGDTVADDLVGKMVRCPQCMRQSCVPNPATGFVPVEPGPKTSTTGQQPTWDDGIVGFNCPVCTMPLVVPSAPAGTTTICANCQDRVQVPSAGRGDSNKRVEHKRRRSGDAYPMTTNKPNKNGAGHEPTEPHAASAADLSSLISLTDAPDYLPKCRGKPVRPATLHRWRLAGRLPCVRIGRRWYVTPETIASLAQPFSRLNDRRQ